MSENGRATEQVVISSLMTGGWKIDIFDASKNPPVKKTSKYVNTGDVAGLFTKAYAFNSGVLDVNIAGIAQAADASCWLVKVPWHLRPVQLYVSTGKKEVVTAAIPPSIWIIKAPATTTNKWSAGVWLDMGEGNVGQYPMSNTYDSGGICWGNVRFPALKFPADLRKIVDLFFASDFNGHLWGSLGGGDFFAYVRNLGKPAITEETDPAKKMEKLYKLLKGDGGYRSNGTLKQIWQTATKNISSEEADF